MLYHQLLWYQGLNTLSARERGAGGTQLSALPPRLLLLNRIERMLVHWFFAAHVMPCAKP